MNDDKPWKIEFASRRIIDKYPRGEREFLRLLGLSRAFVSDRSTVADFRPSDAVYLRLSLHSGLDVEPSTLVHRVARALQAKESQT